MAPKPAADKTNAKVQNKGKGKGGDFPQTSRVEFALPPAMVTCLQAITSRSTQDLWHSPTAVPADLTVEQQAQRRASAVGKLSKRLNGDLRAKEELRAALSTWMTTIGLHLAGLVQRVRALGDKIDADLAEACQDMQAALEAQPSLTTAEQVAVALEAVGKPVWPYPQEQEMLRIAASLRAFSTVEPQARSSDSISEISFGAVGPAMVAPGLEGSHTRSSQVTQSMAADLGPLGWGEPSLRHAPDTTPAPLATTETRAIAEPASIRSKRWRRRNDAEANRPSKSPRREEVMGPPWSASATGTTPEGLHRSPQTHIEEEETLANSAVVLPMTWEGAWLQLLQFATEQGSSLIGEIIRDTRQDTVLPLQDQCPEDRTDLLAAAEAIWTAMVAQADTANYAAIPSLCVQLQELLNRLRLCPSALSGVRQGAILLAQVTVGNLLDPFSYAPTTAQEWLYPAAIAEHGTLARGHIATAPSVTQVMTVLLSQRCPALSTIPDDGVPELF